MQQTVLLLAKETFDTLQMSLMTEIRSSVAPRDIEQFDDLVLKKEIEIMKVGVSIKLNVIHANC